MGVGLVSEVEEAELGWSDGVLCQTKKNVCCLKPPTSFLNDTRMSYTDECLPAELIARQLSNGCV